MRDAVPEPDTWTWPDAYEVEPMTLSEALTAERERQNLTPYELAKRCGMSAARLTDILTGATANPGLLTVCRVLAALGRDLKWLHKEMET